MKAIKQPANQSPPNRSALDRISDLEGLIGSLIQSCQREFQNIQQTNQIHGTQIEALVQELGPDVVARRLEIMRQQFASEQWEKDQKDIAKAVEEGKLVPADMVGEDCIVVGKETDKDGNVRHPGGVAFNYSQSVPEVRDNLLGVGVGAEVSAPQDTKFTVTAIYKPVPKQDAPTGATEEPAPE